MIHISKAHFFSQTPCSLSIYLLWNLLLLKGKWLNFFDYSSGVFCFFFLLLMMTIEAVEVTEFVRDRKDLIREVKDKVIRKKRCRRKLIRKSIGEVTPILTLQKLFLSCQAAFKGHGTVPSSNDVNNLRRILGQSNSFLFLFSSFQFWILRSLRFRGWRVFFCLKLKCLKKCLVS